MPANNKKNYGLGRSKGHQELDLPSGNTCLVKRPGVQGLIKMGILDSFDSLTSLVQTNLDSVDPMKDIKSGVKALAKRPEDIRAGFDLIDKIVVAVVVKPEVLPEPASEAERDDELLYVDEVDLDDKMFILQFVVGGTRDLEAFRKEQRELLDGMEDGAKPEVPA